MTNQEAFDKMMEHLRSLKGRSYDEELDNCVYNGTKCAVGALMTDGEQEKFGDHDSDVSFLLEDMQESGHASMLHTLDLDLLREMQDLHDDCWNWGDEGFIAEDVAEDIAVMFGLTYTKP
jgi:hypothetical protein|tara:strand:- start:776 stop:1135 length:360 start_codon:yes stop_codon:yes gene_type:complete